MPGRMFGGVHEEPQHGGRQSGAPHAPFVQQTGRVGGPQLGERAVDGVVGFGDEGREAGRPARRASLRPRGTRAAASFKRVAARVGEEPIQRAAGVPDVEADRRGAARPRPHLGGRDHRLQARQVFPHLQQRVHHGQHHRVVAGHGPAQPDFGIGHRMTVDQAGCRLRTWGWTCARLHAKASAGAPETRGEEPRGPRRYSEQLCPSFSLPNPIS